MESFDESKFKFTPREKMIFILGQGRALTKVNSFADKSGTPQECAKKIIAYQLELTKEQEIWRQLLN